MKTYRSSSKAFIIALTLVISSCLPAIDNLPPKTPQLQIENLYETSRSMGAFYFFTEALELSGLDYKLRLEGPFTVFAPRNEAFIMYMDNNGYFDLSEVPKEELKEMLLNHMVPGSIPFLELRPEYRSSLKIKDPFDNPISLYIGRQPQFFINGESEIITQHWRASNGFLYLISEIIDVPSISDHISFNPDLSIFSMIVQRSKLSDSPIDLFNEEKATTVFAPNNQAFQNFLDQHPEWNSVSDIPEEKLFEILKDHIIPAENVLFSSLKNGMLIQSLNQSTFQIEKDYDLAEIIDGAGQSAKIRINDIQSSNGVIHIIDKVLMTE